jgi:hypothetical protein
MANEVIFSSDQDISRDISRFSMPKHAAIPCSVVPEDGGGCDALCASAAGLQSFAVYESGAKGVA